MIFCYLACRVSAKSIQILRSMLLLHSTSRLTALEAFGFQSLNIEARSLCKSCALPFFKSFLPLTQQILMNKCDMKLAEWHMIRKSWEAQNAKFTTQAMPRRRSKRGDHLALDRLPTSIATIYDIPRQHSSFFDLF